MHAVYKYVAVLMCFTGFFQYTNAQNLPQGISYQAVMRDNTGQPLALQTITVRFSVRQNAPNGAIHWQETHAVTTNQYGLFLANIGQGTSTGAGSLASFSAIDWTTGVYFVEVEGDDGSGFVNLGTSQLLTVPYAMHARTVEIDQVDDADNDPTNELQDISINGNTIAISNGTGTDLSPVTPSANQVLTWDGTQWVAQNPGSGADNWGTQVVETSGTILSGNGTLANPLQANIIAGSGINVTGNTISNTDPGSSLNLTSSGGTTITGTYPNLTINSPLLNPGTDLLPFGLTGQTLRHDGTSWVANSNLFHDGTKVGIGSTNPAVALHINGAETETNFHGNSSSPATSLRIHNSDLTNNNFSALTFSSHLSNGGQSEMAKIVGLYSNHTVGAEASEMIFMTRGAGNINERMRLSSSGNLGLGTTTPLAKLHIEGVTPSVLIKETPVTNGAAVVIESARQYVLLSNPTGYFRIEDNTAGVSRFNISPTGEVGIGVHTPMQKLHIQNGDVLLETNPGQNSVRLSAGSVIVDDDISSTSRFVSSVNNNWLWGSGKTHTGNDNYHIVHYPNARFDLTVSSTNGFVGLGTINPQARLDISGGNTYFRPNSADLNKILVQDNTGLAMRIYTDASVGTPYDLVLGTYPNGHSNQLFLKQSNANVGIGNNNPTQKLHVSGNVLIPAANEYMYEAAKTKYLFIPHIEFETENQNTANFDKGNFALFGHFSTGTSCGYASAGVHLPQGARITEVRYYVMDNNSGGAACDDLNLTMVRYQPSSGTNTGLVSQFTTGASGTIQQISQNLNELVDNSQYTYKVTFRGAGSTNTTRLYGVRITYTITNAE